MRTIRTEMRRSRTPDLSVPQFRVLAFLSLHPGASLLQVADHIGITPPSASKIVEGLVGRKLLKRESSRRDRRHVELDLSPSGKRKLEYVASEATTCLAALLYPLNEK